MNRFENFDNIFKEYDGSILSKIKIIKLLSKLNSSEIYGFRNYVENLLLKSINDGFKTTQNKVDNFFQKFINSADGSTELFYENSSVLSLDYQSINSCNPKNWGLSIYFKDLIDKKEYTLSVEIMNLLKFQKLKQTSTLTSKTDALNPYHDRKKMIKDIEYSLKLISLINEPVNIDSVSLKLGEKIENIKITPDMFDHILKLILKENGISL